MHKKTNTIIKSSKIRHEIHESTTNSCNMSHEHFNDGLDESEAIRVATMESMCTSQSNNRRRTRRQAHRQSMTHRPMHSSSSSSTSLSTPRGHFFVPCLMFAEYVWAFHYQAVSNTWFYVVTCFFLPIQLSVAAITYEFMFKPIFMASMNTETFSNNTNVDMDHGQIAPSSEASLMSGFWELHPVGSFVYDFWIIIVLSMCVFCISFISIIYSKLSSFRFLMRFYHKDLIETYLTVLAMSVRCAQFGWQQLKWSQKYDSTTSIVFWGIFFILSAWLGLFWAVEQIAVFFRIPILSRLYQRSVGEVVNLIETFSNIISSTIELIITLINNGFVYGFAQVSPMLSFLYLSFLKTLTPLSLSLNKLIQNAIGTSSKMFISLFSIIMDNIALTLLNLVQSFGAEIWRSLESCSEMVVQYSHWCMHSVLRPLFNLIGPHLTRLVRKCFHNIRVGFKSLSSLFDFFIQKVSFITQYVSNVFICKVWGWCSRTVVSFQSFARQTLGRWMRKFNFFINKTVIKLIKLFKWLQHGIEIVSTPLRAMQRFVTTLAKKAYGYLESVLVYYFIEYFVNRFFVQFTRAWWRLIPALLSVRTCFVFLSIPCHAYYQYSFYSSSLRPVLSAMAGYLVAGWSVGIISFILLKDVYYRSFRWSNLTNRQFVATSAASSFYNVHSPIDRMLEHVDLGSVNLIVKVIRTSYNILVHLFVRFIHIVSFVFDAMSTIWSWVVRPVLLKVRQIVLFIWRSPVLCSLATLTLLSLLFAHHQGIYKWERLATGLVFTRDESLNYLRQCSEHCNALSMVCSQQFMTKGLVIFKLCLAVLETTTLQLVSAIENKNVESPRLAWCVWLLIVFATKAQNEIRIKTLNWPFLVLWMTAACGGGPYLTHVLLAVLVWCILGILVRRYEESERRRMLNMRHQTPIRVNNARTASLGKQPLKPTGPGREVVFADQTDCAICLDELSCLSGLSPANRDDVGMLPCGHRFHTQCISEWLQRENRCPVCRQAAHGIDRVLEIVF